MFYIDPQIIQNSDEQRTERSYERIDLDDLRRLGEIAATDRKDFLGRYPDFANQYAERLVAVALCQGAALHFVNGQNGIKDFDVWTFYSESKARRINARRRVSRDFGPSRFGVHPEDTGYRGRRVDLMMRGIPIASAGNAIEAIDNYLRTSGTSTTRHLSQKAVVLIEPRELMGTVAWLPAHLSEMPALAMR